MRHRLQQAATHLAHQMPDTAHARRDLGELARCLRMPGSARQLAAPAPAGPATAAGTAESATHAGTRLRHRQRPPGAGAARPAELAARSEITIRLAEGSAEVGIASVQPRLD
jgi:exodeoxyribonuclease VII large subunit